MNGIIKYPKSFHNEWNVYSLGCCARVCVSVRLLFCYAFVLIVAERYINKSHSSIKTENTMAFRRLSFTEQPIGNELMMNGII